MSDKNFDHINTLPNEIAIFPLSGALLLPGGRLPLNIFESRYLKMINDVMGEGRFLGMIQPDYDHSINVDDSSHSKEVLDSNNTEITLYSTGCLGRIVYFEETDDGRFLVSLRGVSRFKTVREMEKVNVYRKLEVAYSDFEDDIKAAVEFNFDRNKLLDALPSYLDSKGLSLKVDVIKSLSDHSLISSLCMICPFDPREKQALLESDTMQSRSEMLLALLKMGVYETTFQDGKSQ